MKLNKTLMMAALIAGSLFATGALQAQDAPKDATPAAPAPGAKARLNPEQLAKDLGLSDDQKTKFKDAMQDLQKKLQEVRKDASLSQEDRRAKTKEIRDAAQAKFKEILTAEQFEKWQKLMPGARNRPAAGTPPAADAPKN
jgi:Spy/CpxP family protein refolding chaperone